MSDQDDDLYDFELEDEFFDSDEDDLIDGSPPVSVSENLQPTLQPHMHQEQKRPSSVSRGAGVFVRFCVWSVFIAGAAYGGYHIVENIKNISAPTALPIVSLDNAVPQISGDLPMPGKDSFSQEEDKAERVARKEQENVLPGEPEEFESLPVFAEDLFEKSVTQEPEVKEYVEIEQSEEESVLTPMPDAAVLLEDSAHAATDKAEESNQPPPQLDAEIIVAEVPTVLPRDSISLSAVEPSAPISGLSSGKPEKVQNAPQWIIKAVLPGRAVIHDKRSGETRSVEIGDSINAIGRIEEIKKISGQWVIKGSQGLIQQ